jgi:hypothetical protein
MTKKRNADRADGTEGVILETEHNAAIEETVKKQKDALKFQLENLGAQNDVATFLIIRVVASLEGTLLS